MELTDYRALLVDCDEVLVDRDSGIWAALQPLLENHPGSLSKEEVLAEFRQVAHSLYPRFGELGFGGLLCFAHRQLAQRLGLESSWEEGMTFARAAGDWPLFEDAPGAMLYLRKFYRLLVYGDRDSADRDTFCERLGIPPEDLLSRSVNPLLDFAWLSANDLEPKEVLLVSAPSANTPASVDLCLIRRGETDFAPPANVDFCASSMADLVAQHQLSLRR